MVATIHKGVPWKDDAFVKLWIETNETAGMTKFVTRSKTSDFDTLVNPVYFND